MHQRYGRTAIGFVGEVGIKRRSLWNRHFKELAERSDEPNWIAAFARFRMLVDRKLDPNPAASGTIANNLDLYLEVFPNGDSRFLLHDLGSLEAALVTDVGTLVSNETRTALDTVFASISQLPNDKRLDVIRCQVSFGKEKGAALSGLKWQPEISLLPDLHMYPSTIVR